MKILQLHQKWLGKLLPKGLPYPSSTLISGPGGSGKPLIGFAFVCSWLKSGGNVVFIPLQYPKTDFVKTSLRQLYDLNIDNYRKNVTYIQFDYRTITWEKSGENIIRANLLKPEVWEEIIGQAEKSMEKGKNILIFAAALNLLLFSPEYREKSLENIENLLARDKKRTYICSVSTSAFKSQVKK
jgi:archaellum biogenesis ATPase FlaH